MMPFANIVAVLLSAFLFGRYVSLGQMLDILQPLIVALSIMAAALLVRLNRGMPTLDWKSLNPDERKSLTAKIVELSKEYIVVLFAHVVTLVALVVIAANKTVSTLKPMEKSILLAFTGGLIALCAVRMAYIVWRDYDIVKLQKKLIDESADRDALAAAQAEATAKVAAMRSSGLIG